MNRATLLLAGVVLAFSLHALPEDQAQEAEQDVAATAPTACDSDTDCMRHCPPPADDPDCDGGPQDPTPARGDYGTQP
jgi:hypothetical protein